MNRGNQNPQGSQNPDYFKNVSKGFETAAIAAKYLDESSNAKEALELASKKEETKQMEYQESRA
jgi:hypothetical protein